MMEATATFNYEAAGAAMISGVQTRTLPGVDGILDPADVGKAFLSVIRTAPLLVC